MAFLDHGPYQQTRGCRLLLYLLMLLVSLFISVSGIPGPGTNFTFGTGVNSLDEWILAEDAQYNRTTQSILLTANSTRTQGQFACGMFFYHEKVAIRETSFSTTFTFTIRTPYDSWGDGFAFTFREDAVTAGSAGEYLCLLSSKTDANPENHVFAVEFDTFKNDYDPSNNHIGVDVHAIDSVSTYNLCGGVVENCTYLVNHGEFTAWIDYDSPKQLLEVRFSNGSSMGPQGIHKPATAVIVQNIDLSSVVSDEMYVGFVGGTGLKFEIHEILSWSFNSSFAPGGKRGDRNTNKKLALGLSIPLAAVALCSIVACAVILHRLLKQSAAFRALEQELVRQQVQACLYSYNDIKAATRDFHLSNKLGEGGFGIVYKGTLADGTRIAAKRLLRSRHAEGFLNEVVLITGIRHRNLVKLRGCCIKDKQQILVYEYVENKNLAEALWGPGNNYILDWSTRFKICEGIARGLAYLHEDSQPRIIHRDIKATNILLDKEWKAKIADFGLARLFPDEQSHLSTMHIAGTMGYMAPEYATRGQLTDKADVYSFGVLMFEVISGRKNIDFTAAPPERVYLLEWAWNCYEENCLFDLLDVRLSLDHVPLPEVHRALMVAIFCIQPSPSRRPSMSSVLAMLLGEAKLEAVMRLPHISTSEHARLLAEVDLSSPFSTPPNKGLLRLRSVPESTPGSSNVLDISDLEAR
ncbi:hypothetical protein M758_12G164800 [Ceratodon purpureus]|nr:hypothetical protein M758_12G164800 [Ceratodon purpureus]